MRKIGRFQCPKIPKQRDVIEREASTKRFQSFAKNPSDRLFHSILGSSVFAALEVFVAKSLVADTVRRIMRGPVSRQPCSVVRSVVVVDRSNPWKNGRKTETRKREKQRGVCQAACHGPLRGMKHAERPAKREARLINERVAERAK